LNQIRNQKEKHLIEARKFTNKEKNLEKEKIKQKNLKQMAIMLAVINQIQDTCKDIAKVCHLIILPINIRKY
jgi:hypothetical protein